MSQTILVTGASRGIGLEFVKQLKDKGHTVIAAARQPNKSEELCSLVDNKKVFDVTMETSDVNSVKSAFDKVKTIAPEGLDILINNAGVAGPSEHTVLDATPDDYLELFKTNVIGTSNVSQAALPYLRQKSTRKIINLLSSIGSIGMLKYGGKMPYYGASKAAEHYLTRAFASALKEEKFTVAGLHPGWVQTDMGGEKAPVPPSQSVCGLLQQIDQLNLDKTGCFIDYRGQTIED